MFRKVLLFVLTLGFMGGIAMADTMTPGTLDTTTAAPKAPVKKHHKKHMKKAKKAPKPEAAPVANPQ
jgi:hypothetical protein